LISRTGLPSRAEISSATGLSEFSSDHKPSSGRPRCEVTITLAPCFRQWLMVAIEAVIRASDVTLPSLTGTLRSARMNTRLPLRSRSMTLMTDTESSKFFVAWDSLHYPSALSDRKQHGKSSLAHLLHA